MPGQLGDRYHFNDLNKLFVLPNLHCFHGGEGRDIVVRLVVCLAKEGKDIVDGGGHIVDAEHVVVRTKNKEIANAM